MHNTDKYRVFCETQSDISIFNQAWWLDIVAKDRWNVCLIEDEVSVIASMPYYVTEFYKFKIITLPPLTQHLGPWMCLPDSKYCKMLSNQKNVMENLIKKLPHFDYMIQNWHHSLNNWLPFYWESFEQTTKYSYVLENIKNHEVLWSELQENIKREIKKAQNRFNIKILDNLPIDEFIDLNDKTFKRQGIKAPYTRALVKELATKAKERGQCRWFIAKDENGNNHAGVLIVWDKNSAYYLMGGGDPELRNSGATSLCMWEAIMYSSKFVDRFDFEGSMIEPIERFFRGFGAKQQQYFSVYKYNSSTLKLIHTIYKLLKQK